MSLHLRSSPQRVPAVQEYTAHSLSVFSRQARDLIPASPPLAFSLVCCHPGGSPAWLPRSMPLLAQHSLLKSLTMPVPASGVPRSCSRARARTERLQHLSVRPSLLPVARVTIRGLLAGYRAQSPNDRTHSSAELPESPVRPVLPDVHTSRDECGASVSLLRTPAACPGHTAGSSPATGSVPHRCVAPPAPTIYRSGRRGHPAHRMRRLAHLRRSPRPLRAKSCQQTPRADGSRPVHVLTTSHSSSP